MNIRRDQSYSGSLPLGIEKNIIDSMIYLSKKN